MIKGNWMPMGRPLPKSYVPDQVPRRRRLILPFILGAWILIINKLVFGTVMKLSRWLTLEFSILKEWIIAYCIGEGFIDDLYTEMDEIYNKGHDLLLDLKTASLLESEDEEHIRMHPMVRAMALWIASVLPPCLYHLRQSLTQRFWKNKALPRLVHWSWPASAV